MHKEPLMLDSNIAFYLRIMNKKVLIHGRTEGRTSQGVTPSKRLDGRSREFWPCRTDEKE